MIGKEKSSQILLRCDDPDNPLVIDAEGNVVVCANDYLGRVKLGNIGESRLLDIWKSQKFTDIRRGLRNQHYTLPICLSCTGQANQIDTALINILSYNFGLRVKGCSRKPDAHLSFVD